MRLARFAAAVLVLPALALAQDPKGPGEPGTLLWDALPPGADIVVEAPSLPALLRSAPSLGFGTREGWAAAFRDQLLRWGAATGEPERLAAAGEALLAKADGEALVAGVELPRSGASSPRTRATLLAFRTSALQKDLDPLVNELAVAGLRARWNGTPTTDRSAGRSLLLLPADFDGLWIRVEDHLVAAADHPTALGLLFRGIERAQRSAKPPEDVGAIPLRVRYGRTESPERWEGMTFLQREGLSTPAGRRFMNAARMPDPAAILSLSFAQPFDAPLFPVRVPEGDLERGRAMNARPLALSLLGDGTFDLRGTGGANPDPDSSERPVVGGAARLAWLRAMVSGKIALPVPCVSADSLRIALAAADAAKAADAPAFYDWRPTEEPGELRGPAWHGPVTFLALRALSDISHGFAPPGSSPAEARSRAPGSTDADDVPAEPAKSGGPTEPPLELPPPRKPGPPLLPPNPRSD